MNNPLRSLFYVATTLLSTAFLVSGQQSFITQVQDINQSSLPASSSADSLVNVNGTLFLATDDELTGAELWKLPPGGNAFQFITDIAPGPDGSSPRNLTAIGDKLYFAADETGSTAGDLWVSDGTAAGTSMLKSLDYSARFTPFLGALFFEGEGGGTGQELWKSDLTANGTSLFKNIRSGGDSFLGNLKVVGGTTMFFTADDGLGQALWKTDGTANGTVLVKDPIPLSNLEDFSLFTDVGGTLFFRALGSGSGYELWKSDGTEAGTGIVTEIQDGSSGGGPRELTSVNLTGVGPRLFFTADNGVNGRELWISDGNDFNTQMVRDIRTLDASEDPATAPASLTAMNGWLFFTANQITSGRELWRSDGTLAGTALVADLVVGVNGSEPANLIDVNGTLFFTTSSNNNLRLWKMTFAVVNNVFTPTVTEVKDLPETPDTATTAISNLVVVGDTLFFKLNDDEIWKTDGTDPGTVQVQRFRSGTSSSMPGEFALIGNEAYFAANDGTTGREVWKTDSTNGGTVLVSDVSLTGSSNPAEFTPLGTSLGDFVFFSAAASGVHREVFMRDPNGSVSEVMDINSLSANGSQPGGLTSFNGLMFFAATEQHAAPTRSSGRELWRSDPVQGVTELVKDIAAGTASSSPSNFRVAGNYLFFTAADGNGTEIWRTDGTEGETKRLKDIAEGATGSAPSNLVTLGTTLFFAADDGASKGRELWKSNGAFDANGVATGTVMVKDIRTGTGDGLAVQAYLTPVEKLKLVFFAANDGKTGLELWRTNGTDAGTTLVKDINPLVNGSVNQSSSPTQLVAVGDKLFFVANDGVNGQELWRSDGSSSGTFMVKNIIANGDADIRDITDVNGLACFSVDNGVNGRELWVSDGTAAGTFLVPQDLTGDDSSSMPNELFPFKSGLLFAATTRAVGTELFFAAVGPEIAVEQPVANGLVDNVSVVDFGEWAVPTSTTLSIRIKNTGINNLTGVAATIAGQHAADYTITTKPAALVAPNGSTDLVVKFAPREDGVRNAVLRIASNDGDENPFEVILKGTGDKNPAITAHPVSQMVQVGAQVTFTSAATDPTPFTVQWLRNKGVIPGATNPTLKIPAASTTDAGTYTFQAKNAAKVVSTSDPAELGVVENLPKLVAAAINTNVTFTVKASGNGLTYLWKKNGGALPVDPRITGGNTKTLTIKGLILGDTAVYTCVVSGPGGSAIGGTTDLRVFNARPQLADPQNMPDGIVSGTYQHQIAIVGGTETTPSLYSITPVPPGLKLDTKTGFLGGKPTKAGTYNLRISASNSVGKVLADVFETIVIADFPTGLAGSYSGIVERSVALNGNLGGRIDVTITSTGGFTGNLTLGLIKHPLKGALDLNLNGTPMVPTVTVFIKRTGLLPPLTVTFTLVPAAAPPQDTRIVNGSVADDVNNVAFSGWQNVWNATTNKAEIFIGTYNFAFGVDVPPANPDVPLGYGYGSLKVANSGVVTGTGKSPDGETLTFGGSLSRLGEFPIFQTLFAPTKGSLRGILDLDDVGNANPADNTLAGALDAFRPPNTTAAARIYEKGYDPLDMIAFGAIWTTPVAPEMILGLQEPGGTDNAVLKLEDGGLTAAINIDFDVGPKSKVTMPPAGVDNPVAAKLTITLASGLFTGSFVKEDPDPRAAFAGKNFKRTGTISGILTTDGVGKFGAGHFKLEELPSDGDAGANPPVPATTPTTSDINFGSVRVEKK